MKRRVLIIDDEAGKRKILGRLLGGEYELKYALDGKSGIETAMQFDPELVLLDIAMPEMNGFTACETLRAMPQFANAKIMVVTGRALQEDRERAMQLGANDYVALPFDEDEFLLRVNLLFQLRDMELEIMSMRSGRSMSMGMSR